VDVLSSLTRRRTELDARERGLDMRENLLSASEGRVDQKIAALKDLQTQIQGLLVQRDAAQDAQIKSLIKSYGPDGMKPAESAAIFNTMPDDVLLPIAKGMKPGDLGAILAKMNPEAAQKLTVKLAALLKLPEPPPAVCPVPPATPPGTSADATPPDMNPVVTPLQTAALTPPPAAAPPPVVTPLPPTPPAATPPAPTPPAQTAATPPPARPHHPAAHHVTPAKPATAAAAPPAKPATAAATPPAKPTTAAATTPATPPTATPPAKPQTAAATPPATPAATPPAVTPPAKPATQAANGPPTATTPPSGG
jgi:hypothetical protein